MDWELDEKQREAVESDESAVMVVAGPGTGKTRVLTARAVYLTETLGIDPSRILAITYTNRAAAEMRSRLVSRIDSPSGEVPVSTFHAWAYRLVRKYHRILGLTREPIVFDEESTEQLLMRLAGRERIPEEAVSIRHLKQLLDRVKAQIAFPIKDEKFDPEFWSGITDIFKAYQTELINRSALDFSDILIAALELLYCFPDAAEEVKNSTDHLLIDEFQDINTAQYRLVEALHRPGMKLFAVGDEDQTIYTFRGSRGEFIDLFVADFNAKLIPLTGSYRCSDGILFAAGNLIGKNRRSYQQPPSPPRDMANKRPLLVFEVEDEEEEARMVAKVVRSWVESGCDYKGIAVLYRVHNLADECERVLIESGIPVVRLSPEKQRRELTDDPLPFLRLAVTDNEWDWDRSLGLPRDRLGELDDLRLRLAATREGITLDRLIARPARFRHLSPLGQARLKKLNEFVCSIRKDASKEAPSMLLNRAVGHLTATKSPWRPHEDSWLREEEEHLSGFDRISPEALLEEWTKSKTGIKILHAPTITAVIASEIIKSGCREVIGVEAESFALSASPPDISKIPPDSRPVVVIGLNIEPENIFPSDVLLPRAIYINRDGISEKPAEEACADESFSLALGAHRFIAELAGYRPGGAPGEDIVFFDIETTGTDIYRSEIVEIAAIRVHLKGNSARELGQFQSFVKPSRPIPASATEVHKITDNDVKNAQDISEVLARFIDFVGDSPLAGHNIDNFDVPIIRRDAARVLKRMVGNFTLDTLPLSKRLLPGEPHRLEVLAEKFGIDVTVAHRALDDVRTNIAVFNKLMEFDEGFRARGFAPDIPLMLAVAHSMDFESDTDPAYIRSAAARYITNSGSDSNLNRLMPALAPSAWNRIQSSVRSLSKMEYVPDESDTEFANRVQFLRSEALRLEDENPSISLLEYLSHIAMLTDSDFDSEEDAVRMLTIHAAKGLEFERIIIIGAEQGNLPHYLATNKTVSEVEEERRLTYVAITRARKKAAIMYARRRFGRWRPPSMFIGELPKISYKKFRTKDRVTGE
ncbi:MAG TPA: hypothetical protein ENN67_00150 [Firmicutes bacterium]|nr:hypothetical protein [Bacillota bacterium]